MNPVPWIWLSITACHSQDAGPTASPDDTGPDASSAPEFRYDTGHWPEHGFTVMEQCDGEDNDEDGEIDEGFPDSDADGVADCLDRVCEVQALERVAVDLGTSCVAEVEVAADPWNVELFWTGGDGGYTRYRSDTIADLSGGTAKEIAYIQASSGVRYLLEIYEASANPSTTALAGLVGEEALSILFEPSSDVRYGLIAGGGRIEAYREDQTLVWTSSIGFGPWQNGSPSYNMGIFYHDLQAVRLQAGGAVMLGNDRGFVDSADGGTILELDHRDDILDSSIDVAVADLDQDGEAKIAAQFIVRDAEGSISWDLPLYPDADVYLANPALLQIDADPMAEILWLTNNSMLMVDDDGTVLWEQDLPLPGYTIDRLYSHACAGDLDGDGLMEVAYSDHSFLYAIDGDGTELWKEPIEDLTGGGSCSVFDFDLDGTHELLHSDEGRFTIRDGPTGAVLYEDPTWVSATILDLPKVVDLDGDGSVEIVLTGTGEFNEDVGHRIHVYSHADAAWPPGFPGWYGQSWSGVERRSDGRVPHTRDPSWLEPGVWRGQAANPALGMDLHPEIVDSCVSSLEDDEAEVHLAVRLVNPGPEEAMEEARLGVYLLDADGQPSLFRLYELGDIVNQGSSDGGEDYGDADGDDTASPEPTMTHPYIDEGEATRTLDLRFTLGQVKHGLMLVAGDDGSGTARVHDFECSAADNVLVWTVEGALGSG